MRWMTGNENLNENISSIIINLNDNVIIIIIHQSLSIIQYYSFDPFFQEHAQPFSDPFPGRHMPAIVAIVCMHCPDYHCCRQLGDGVGVLLQTGTYQPVEQMGGGGDSTRPTIACLPVWLQALPHTHVLFLGAFLTHPPRSTTTCCCAEHNFPCYICLQCICNMKFSGGFPSCEGWRWEAGSAAVCCWARSAAAWATQPTTAYAAANTPTCLA